MVIWRLSGNSLQTWTISCHLTVLCAPTLLTSEFKNGKTRKTQNTHSRSSNVRTRSYATHQKRIRKASSQLTKSTMMSIDLYFEIITNSVIYNFQFSKLCSKKKRILPSSWPQQTSLSQLAELALPTVFGRKVSLADKSITRVSKRVSPQERLAMSPIAINASSKVIWHTNVWTSRANFPKACQS